MVSQQENQLLFQFLVLVAWLERANTRGLEMDLLIHIRDAFFSDPDKVESALPLQDIHGAIQKVIKLDGIGPADNRPSTKAPQLWFFFSIKKNFDS